jgi:hypothetical protein
MATHPAPLRGRVAFAASTLAVLYGIAFLVWAMTTPPYDGLGLLAAQSLVVAAPMWLLLRRRCSTGVGGTAGELVAVAFLVWSVVAGFSLAFGTFPAAALLLVAVLAVPAGRPRAASA